MNNAEINQKIKKHLDNALKLCREYDKERLITEWVDDIDFVEGYGYTEELEDEIEYLRERLTDLTLQNDLPKVISLNDSMKIEFFLKNFNKFTERDLERIVDSFRYLR